MRALVKAGATVQVVMTEAAEQFITPVTLQALSNRAGLHEPVGRARAEQHGAHQPDARGRCDRSSRRPAPTSSPSSLHGRADDLLSPAVPGAADRALPAAGRAGDEPRDVGAPGDAAQRRAARAPTARRVLGPGSGDQACGEIGDGRMLEPDELLDELIAFFQPKLLAGKRVLSPPARPSSRSTRCAASPTARAARWASRSRAPPPRPAPTSRWSPARSRLPTPRGVRRIDVTTAARDARRGAGRSRRRSDVFVATAAVADWRAGRRRRRRRSRRTAGRRVPTLRAGREPRHPRRRRRAAEARRSASASPPRATTCSRNARAKRERRSVPLIVANLGPATFGQRRQRADAGRRARRARAAARRQARRSRASWSPRSRRGSRAARRHEPPTAR